MSTLNDSSVIIWGTIYKIGSRAGFESASGSRGFCTRMRVWPALGGHLAGLPKVWCNERRCLSFRRL